MLFLTIILLKLYRCVFTAKMAVIITKRSMYYNNVNCVEPINFQHKLDIKVSYKKLSILIFLRIFYCNFLNLKLF